MRAWLLPAAAGLSVFLVMCGGIWGTLPVWSPHGAGVKTANPAEQRPSLLRRLDGGEHGRMMSCPAMPSATTVYPSRPGPAGDAGIRIQTPALASWTGCHRLPDTASR